MSRDEPFLLKALQVRQEVLPAHEAEFMHDLVIRRVADAIPAGAQVKID